MGYPLSWETQNPKPQIYPYKGSITPFKGTPDLGNPPPNREFAAANMGVLFGDPPGRSVRFRVWGLGFKVFGFRG